MASMPMDQERHARRGGGKPPISAHPAFPAIVALWFAALLGLGSLILPVQLIEGLIRATGITSFIPAAAPPLGFTARAAIAFSATAFGALLGVVLARRLARANRHAAYNEYIESAAESRVLSPHDDLDGDSIEAEDTYPDADYEPEETEGQRKRRRALAFEEEDGPSDFLYLAPLPGVKADAGDSADFDALELGSEAELKGDFDSDPPGAEQASYEARPGAERHEFIAPGSTIGGESEEEVGEEPASFAFRDRSQNGEPLLFSPPSMARQTQSAAGQATRPFDAQQESEVADADPINAEPEEIQEDPVPDKQAFSAVSQAFETPSQIEEAARKAEPDAVDYAPVSANTRVEGDVEGVGLVQLVQKLGSTLEKHREWSAQRAAQAATAPVRAEAAPPAEVAPAVPQDFEAARPDDAAEAMAAYFHKSSDNKPAQAVPESSTPKMRTQYAPLDSNVRVSDDLEDDGENAEIADLGASFSLPVSQQVSSAPVTPAPRPAFDIPPPGAAPLPKVAEEECEEHTSLSDASYGSLSAVNNPFKTPTREFVRIDEPESETPQPAVIFPNRAERKPASAHEPGGMAEPALPKNVSSPLDRAAENPAAARREQRQPASNDDNERALREALMNLQRMSK